MLGKIRPNLQDYCTIEDNKCKRHKPSDYPFFKLSILQAKEGFPTVLGNTQDHCNPVHWQLCTCSVARVWGLPSCLSEEVEIAEQHNQRLALLDSDRRIWCKLDRYASWNGWDHLC